MSAKTHQIQLSDFANHGIKKELAGSYGLTENKTLFVKVNCWTMQIFFAVANHDKEKTFSNLEKAIKYYNEI